MTRWDFDLNIIKMKGCGNLRIVYRILLAIIILIPLSLLFLSLFTNYVLLHANRMEYSFEYWDTDESRKYTSVAINEEDTRSICSLISNSEYGYIFSDTGIFDQGVAITIYSNDWCHIKLLMSRSGTGTALRYVCIPLGYYCPKDYIKIEEILLQYTTDYRVIGPG